MPPVIPSQREQMETIQEAESADAPSAFSIPKVEEAPEGPPPMPIQYGGILDVCTAIIQADVEKIKFRKPTQKFVHWLTKEELGAFLSQLDAQKGRTA